MSCFFYNRREIYGKVENETNPVSDIYFICYLFLSRQHDFSLRQWDRLPESIILQALAGFILTDAGIALLGIIAVVLVGNKIMILESW